VTRPYAEVIGDPIAQSKSPAIHNYWLGTLGIDAEYRACHVTADGLAEYVETRREDPAWRGCNVTMPHKQAIVPLLDRLEIGAELVEAVNTVIPRRNGMLVGSNTDGAGVLGAIDIFKPPFCLIGNGGAARAALATLDPVKPDWLRLLVRNPEAGQALVDSMSPLEASVFGFDRFADALRGCNGLINATSLGMTGQSPMPPALLELLPTLASGAFVFDMVYSPLETELLKAARGAGFRTIDGLSMLIGQAAVAFEKFFGQPPPRDEGDRELRALLTP